MTLRTLGTNAAALNNAFVQTVSPLDSAYGAAGNGTTDDTTALNNAIAAGASFGIPVDLRGKTYKTTDVVTVPAGVTVRNGIIHCTGTGKTILNVTGNNVTLQRLTINGRHSVATFSANEKAIAVVGASAASPITGLVIEKCAIEFVGMYGIYLNWVTGFRIAGCDIGDLGYAGVMGLSVLNGHIVDNSVSTVLAGSGGNGYGIALSRVTTDSLVTDPRSANIMVARNRISSIPWEGLDTHAGDNITFSDNIVTGCSVGIAAVSANNVSAAQTWAPLNIKIQGNIIDSGVTDGTKGIGISVAGAFGVLGTSTQHGTGSITGNVIRNHGSEATTTSGGIRLRDTTGFVVSGNAIFQPSPHGIVLDNDNYGVSVSGNTVVDHWSNTVSTPSVVHIPTGYVTGNVVGNVHRNESGKSGATYSNVRGYNNTSATGVTIEATGNSLGECTTPVNGLTATSTVFRFNANFQQTAIFAAGSAGSPSCYWGTDTNTGFYTVGTGQLGFTAGGTLRMRFTTTGITFADGMVLSVGSTSGLVIGAGTTQKLGFYGHAVVAQQSGTPAAATDLATSLTLVNDLRTKLLATGLFA